MGPAGKHLLPLALLAAVLLAPAAGATAPTRRSAYAGLGTWVDIYSTSAWASPERAVAAMARDGVRTLYLQTGNYDQAADVVRPRAVGRFVDAAHAAGLRVVAWYLPSFADLARDARRALAAIRFRSARGGRFDSFALDVEAGFVDPVSLRNRRLLELSRRLRRAVGRRYGLGVIVPSAVGMRRHPAYWPGFPYRGLARWYDVFLPMAYATDAHVHGSSATRAYDAADVAAIRRRTGDPHVPIHLIGGIGDAMGAGEIAGFMRAVAESAPVGYSLYDFVVTSRSAWAALNAHPPGG